LAQDQILELLNPLWAPITEWEALPAKELASIYVGHAGT